MTQERTAGGGELPKGKAKEEKGGGKEQREDFREKLKEAAKPVEPPGPTEAEKKATATAFKAEMPEKRKTCDLPLSSLQENPDNKRSDFGDLKGLAASLAAVGLLQRILVRPGDRDGKFQIIFGHRRFRAAKLAGLKEVPVEIVDVADSLAFESQLIENVQRKDVNPMEEADTYDLLARKVGYSAKQIGQRVGKSEGWVYARLKLRALCPEARKAVKDGALAANVGVALARIRSQAKQSEALIRVTGLSTRDALEYLQGDFTQSLKSPPFDMKDPDLVPVKTEAGGFTFGGSCLKCPQKTGAVPGLFDDMKGQGFDSCTHTPCFKLKAAASWEKKTASAKKNGAKVLNLQESKKVFHAGNLAWNSGFVKADAPAEGDKKKRTYAQLLSKLPEAKQPEPVLASSDGKPVKLFKKEEAIAALAAAGMKWAEGEERSYTPPTPEEQARLTREREVRQEIVRRTLLRAGEKISKFGLPELRIVAAALSRHDADGMLSAISGEEETKAIDWLEKKAEPADLHRVIFTFAAADLAGGGWNGFSDDFKAIAKDYEVPVSEIQKDVEAEFDRAEEETKKKSATKEAVPATGDNLATLETQAKDFHGKGKKKAAKKSEARP